MFDGGFVGAGGDFEGDEDIVAFFLEALEIGCGQAVVGFEVVEGGFEGDGVDAAFD